MGLRYCYLQRNGYAFGDLPADHALSLRAPQPNVQRSIEGFPTNHAYVRVGDEANFSEIAEQPWVAIRNA